MSTDLINSEGGHWKSGTSLWIAILSTAGQYGWIPAGTVMYKHSGLHADQIVINTKDLPEGVVTSYDLTDPDSLPEGETSGPINFRIVIEETAGDRALGFDQATKSRELDPDWDKNYWSNDGQIITATDASNIVEALSSALQAGEWKDDPEYIQELISVLQGGECRIL